MVEEDGGGSNQVIIMIRESNQGDGYENARTDGGFDAVVW